jgi:hypothetical protein
MTKKSRLPLRLALAMFAVLALATPAAADEPAPAGEGAAGAPEGEESKVMAPEPPSEPAPEAAASRFPRTVFLRPLTLPKGLVMAGADVVILNTDPSLVLAAPIIGYGITDKLEVQVPYVFAVKEFEAKGLLDIDVGFVVLRGAVGGKLEVVARVRGGYSLLAEEARPLLIGAHAAFNVTDKIAIISGIPGQQQLRISLAGDVKPIDFSLPIGVGVQVTPLLYFQLDTKLAQIKIADSANVFIGSDTTPVALTATYNVIPALDVLAGVAMDLTPVEPAGVGDTLAFFFGVRYFGGKL